MSDPNDSSVAGYLRPEPAFGMDLENNEVQGFDEGYFDAQVPPSQYGLNAAIQSMIVGITGLQGSLVRLRWQPEPGNIPSAATAWCAFGVTETEADTFASLTHLSGSDGSASDLFERNEILTVLCSFYGLGNNSFATYYANLLKDGLYIEQNRYAMKSANLAVVEAKRITPVPSLMKERWLYRVDLPVVLRRLVKRSYPVQNIVSASAVIKAETVGDTPVPTQTIIVSK